MEWFQNAVKCARELFDRPCEYPLIDDDEVLDEEVVYESWPWELKLSGHSRDELLEDALTSNHYDCAVHFVWLNLFYRLAHYPADMIASDVEDRDNAEEHRKEFLSDLKTLVGMTKDEAVNSKDLRRLRWEVSNACAVQDWDTASRLYIRLEELAETRAERSQIIAMYGRCEFLTVFARLWELDELDLDMWAPAPVRPWTGLINLGLAVRSLAAVDPTVSLPPAEESRVESAAYRLSKAIKGSMDADLIYGCMLLRCRLALGRFRDAAADCEALLSRREEFSSGPWEGIHPEPPIISRLYALAVGSYEADGQIDRAITASDRWLKDCPDEPGIHECRSRLFQKQGDLEAAYADLRAEVDRNPLCGEDPNVSMAIRFGELYRAPDVQWKRFRRGLDPSEIDLVRSLVTVHWPAATRLDDRSFGQWIDGCCLLFKRVPDNPAMAVFAFGGLAETELRTRIFERFRKTMETEIASLLSENEDPLTRYLRRGAITLEQMRREIQDAKARSAAAQKLQEWLRREKFAGWLQRIDLRSLAELNNRAKHTREPFLDWKDAEEMARLTRELLDVLLGSGTQPSGPRPSVRS
jgi:tetratricopeptide (TPR) repeat protein